MRGYLSTGSGYSFRYEATATTEAGVDLHRDVFAAAVRELVGRQVRWRGAELEFHAGTSTQCWFLAESTTAWVSTATRSPSAKLGSPSGLPPAMAAYASATNALKES
jgi:hypothetical protein